MEIKTKFDVGDDVWMIHNNKVICSRVRLVNAYKEKGSRGIDISYQVRDVYSNVSGSKLYSSVDESRVFASRQQLINSL